MTLTEKPEESTPCLTIFHGDGKVSTYDNPKIDQVIRIDAKSLFEFMMTDIDDFATTLSYTFEIELD